VTPRRAIVGALLVGAGLAAAGFGFALREHSEPAAASSPAQQTTRCRKPASPPTIERPRWYTTRRMTVLVDSVLLGGMDALRRRMPRWKIAQVGRPAIMIRILNDELRDSGRHVAPLVVIGVGYNSLWERNRRNYKVWAAEFDRRARALMATLKRAGADQFVWVTLRNARRSVIPENSLWQFDAYAWYFPYVNERLKRLDRRRGDLALAKWGSVSNKPELTYDAIHLNPKGAALMATTIREAVDAAGHEQTTVTEHETAGC
jgi:hypothetical protein